MISSFMHSTRADPMIPQNIIQVIKVAPSPIEGAPLFEVVYNTERYAYRMASRLYRLHANGD